MANSYITINPASGGGPYKVKILFEGFEPATISLQNYERTLNGKASLNINATRASFDTFVGAFKVAQTAPTGYATLAQIKTWMTSGVANDRAVTVVDDLGGSRNMIFINEYRPQSLGIVRDSATNFWIVPFELHEQ